MPEDPWAKGYLDPDAIYDGGSVYSQGDVVKPSGLSRGILGGMEANPSRQVGASGLVPGQLDRRQ